MLTLSIENISEKFVLQYTKDFLSGDTKKLVKTLTDISALYNFVLKGGGKKTNPWLEYVKEYRKKHPEKSYKECLKCASC